MAASTKGMKAFVVAATLAIGGCSEGDAASATCSPSGTELHIAVLESASHQFTEDCLAAPAGEAFTIEFDNQDTSPHGVHNVHIFDGEDSFTGEFAKAGTSVTYEVGAFDAGTYQFICDNHPGMKGAFIVE